jgi:hypothetical protein
MIVPWMYGKPQENVIYVERYKILKKTIFFKANLLGNQPYFAIGLKSEYGELYESAFIH